MLNVNFFAIILAVIFNFALGMIWYGPLFGKRWIQLTHLSPKDIEKAKKKGMFGTMLTALISNFIMAWILASLIIKTGSATLVGGVMIGFFIWLGFISTVTLGTVLWEGKPKELWILNNAYNLINLLIMGAILGSWQ